MSICKRNSLREHLWRTVSLTFWLVWMAYPVYLIAKFKQKMTLFRIRYGPPTNWINGRCKDLRGYHAESTEPDAKVKKGVTWYFYRCSQKEVLDPRPAHGENFYWCPFSDEILPDSVCITRSGKTWAPTDERSWNHRVNRQSVTSPVDLIKKRDKTIEFRRLQRIELGNCFEPRPMPRMDDTLIKIRKAKYISATDSL